jgi:fructan beta-fructosidase
MRIPLATLLAVTCLATSLFAEEGLYSELHRPQFHFTPERNWMNDPNGLVYHDGEYHLFYQYNPHGDRWGHMSWGHAVSPDLLHWQHLPVALLEENGIMIFSGSAVADLDNTSGFGTKDNPPLVAIYTGHTDKEQNQHIAYSVDKGRTWTKYKGNPVIDENLKDFRDPKVMWHGPTKRWVMVVGLPTQQKVRFYASPDLKTWTKLSEFGQQGATGGIWECPDLFEVPVEGAKGSRWMLVVNINGGTPAGGSACQYFVGTFDGNAFTNENAKDVALWADWGADFFAAQSWSNAPDDKRFWLAWMTNWRYANDEPTKPFRTAQSIPRQLKLVETKQGLRLAQTPVDLSKLRSGAFALGGPDHATADHDPVNIRGDALEIRVTFQIDTSNDFGLKLRHNDKEQTLVGYDVKQQRLYVDRTKSGANFHKDFPARHTASLAPGDDKQVMLHVLLDRSSVEVFAGNGTVVITDRIFPGADALDVSAYAVDGRVNIPAFESWKLNSVWAKQNE